MVSGVRRSWETLAKSSRRRPSVFASSGDRDGDNPPGLYGGDPYSAAFVPDADTAAGQALCGKAVLIAHILPAQLVADENAGPSTGAELIGGGHQLVAVKPARHLPLMKNRGLALTREQLLTNVWGYDFYGDDRTLDTHIKLLRRRLGPYSPHHQLLGGKERRFGMVRIFVLYVSAWFGVCFMVPFPKTHFAVSRHTVSEIGSRKGPGPCCG